jgi:REP element-mobilizing transposase RayT
MSFTKLRYHLVFATKARRRCLHELERTFVWQTLDELTEDIGGYPIATGGVEDHVHTLLAIPPTTAVSEFVKQLKRRATTVIRKRFAHLKGFQWQKGYGGFTVSAHEMGG